MENCNVNIYYALKFYDKEEKGKIHRSDFKQILVWLNLNIDEQTQNLLINYIAENEWINVNQFLLKIKIAEHKIVNIFFFNSLILPRPTLFLYFL